MNSNNNILIVFLAIILSIGFLKVSIAQNDSEIYITEFTYSKDSLENFKGEVKHYAYQEFPELKYTKPKLNKWIKGLTQIPQPSKNIKYISIATKNEQIKYIRIISDSLTFRKEIYSVLNDTIHLEVSGLIVSMQNYSLYIYKNNLLYKQDLYLSCSFDENTINKLQFCLYKTEEYEYYKGSKAIRFITTRYINKLANSEKDNKKEYSKSGVLIDKHMDIK